MTRHGKAWLAGLLILGFALTLPLWLTTSPEQKKQVSMDTAIHKAVEHNVGPLINLEREEKALLRSMLKPIPAEVLKRIEEEVWIKDLLSIVQRHVKSAEEAEEIAKWVYLYSKRYDLPPELILAMITVESHFDRFAVSDAGARGLMQVMPFWKEELGAPEDNLFDIETNIRYGCAVIRLYLDRYGSLPKALAAYNGSLGSNRYPRKVLRTMKRYKLGRPVLG